MNTLKTTMITAFLICSTAFTCSAQTHTQGKRSSALQGNGSGANRLAAGDRLTAKSEISARLRANNVKGAARIHGDRVATVIEDLCSQPTKISKQTGRWSDDQTWEPAGVPTDGDRVRIAEGHVVTVDSQNDAALPCVSVSPNATLRFDPNQNTRLKVGTLNVLDNMDDASLANGKLEIGTRDNPISFDRIAEVVFLDLEPDDSEKLKTGLVSSGDVSIFGSRKTTFAALDLSHYRKPGPDEGGPHRSDGSSTSAQLYLDGPVAGWRRGDKLVLPDTRALRDEEEYRGEHYIPQCEVVTLQEDADNTNVLTVDPLQHDHLGANGMNGLLTFVGHVGNLTRNVVLRSEAPTGNRGHVLFTHRGRVKVYYAQFQDLGRTTNGDIGENNIRGRYALHNHHLFGPAKPVDPYQFEEVGNAIAGFTKWGITIHNSHFGLIKDNVIYNGFGSGIFTEEGRETGNNIEHNFVLMVAGDKNPRTEDGLDYPDQGRAGYGIWSQFNNYVVNNVVTDIINRQTADVGSIGFDLYAKSPATSVTIPLQPGDDPDDPGHGQTVDPKFQRLLAFRGNVAYGPMSVGASVWHYWWNGYDDSAPGEQGVIEDFTAWNIVHFSFFGYVFKNITFDGFRAYGHPRQFGPYQNTVGWTTGDYAFKDVTIKNADIENMASAGLGDVQDPLGTITIEDGFFGNNQGADIQLTNPRSPASKNLLGPHDWIIKNVRFAPAPEHATICLDYEDSDSAAQNSNFVMPSQIRVIDYNGTPGDNFLVYFLEQANDYPLRPTAIEPPPRNLHIIACPPDSEDCTNAYLWSHYKPWDPDNPDTFERKASPDPTTPGLAVFGGITPCEDTITHPEIFGFTCSAGNGLSTTSRHPQGLIMPSATTIVPASRR